MSAPTTFADVAARLHAHGYRVIPIAPGKKYPAFEGWQNFTYRVGCESDHPNRGAGVLAEKTPGLDIDVSAEEVVARIEETARNVLGLSDSAQMPRHYGVYQAAGKGGRVTRGRRPSRAELAAAMRHWDALHDTGEPPGDAEKESAVGLATTTTGTAGGESKDSTRAAAQERFRRAKKSFTVACEAVLSGKRFAAEQATDALAELNEARAALARIAGGES